MYLSCLQRMEWFTLFDTYILNFAAGAMIYVVVEELIPEAKEGEHTNLSTIGLQLDLHLLWY